MHFQLMDSVALHRPCDQRYRGANFWRGPFVHAQWICVFWPPNRFFLSWLGGWLYDRTGSYDMVWYIAIALASWPQR